MGRDSSRVWVIWPFPGLSFLSVPVMSPTCHVSSKVPPTLLRCSWRPFTGGGADEGQPVLGFPVSWINLLSSASLRHFVTAMGSGLERTKTLAGLWCWIRPPRTLRTVVLAAWWVCKSTKAAWRCRNVSASSSLFSRRVGRPCSAWVHSATAKP